MQRLQEFYDRHKRAVFGYLFHMSGSREEAEDLTQETFYQAMLSLPRFRGDASVSTWLLGIARNVALKRFRSRRREIAVADPEAAMSDEAVPGPEQAMLSLGEQETVGRALTRLPEQYRTALVLREVQGLGHAEIGRILGKTESTVRVLVHRARQRLLELYSEEEGAR